MLGLHTNALTSSLHKKYQQALVGGQTLLFLCFSSDFFLRGLPQGHETLGKCGGSMETNPTHRTPTSIICSLTAVCISPSVIQC